MTATCRQIRQEALPLFYSSNCFLFYTEVLHDWADEEITEREAEYCVAGVKNWHNILAARSSYLRHVRINFHTRCTDDDKDECLVHRLPKWIADFQSIFAGTKTRLEVRLNIKWHPLVDHSEVDETLHPQLTVAPSDLEKCREDIKNQVQDEESMIKKLIALHLELGSDVAEGSLRAQAKTDIQRARLLFDQFADVLGTTNFDT